MTIDDLSEYLRLRKRFMRDERMLESLRARIHPGAQVITGMPHVSGESDNVGDLVADIVDAEEQLRKLLERCDQAKTMVTEYISTIDDGQTRMIFRLRFLRCLTWTEVAAMIGGGNTANSVRMVCSRYLAAEEE